MFKRTKIVCTIGPACSSGPVLTEMIKAGMNVARFNFSHGTHESNLALLNTVREAAKKAKLPVALLLDLQGPKIRIGELPEEGLQLKEGETVTLVAGTTKSEPNTIPIPYPEASTSISKGDLILLDDGTKELEVISVKDNQIKAKVLLGGKLLPKKGITIPRVSLVKESMTAKDEDDLRFGLQHGIDFVALSFVRQADDVVKLKKKIKQYLPKGLPTPAVIVKVEKPEAIDNFDAILDEADGIMIARGDLALESPLSEVPLHQKTIIRKCLALAKPVITATEMLGSMQFNPRPTRAEASDVANAVFDHTDAVMLSGETAMGKHPARAVHTMSTIIAAAENSPHLHRPLAATEEASSPFAVADSVIQLASTVSAKAIVVTTNSGYFARSFARLRIPLPILALSPSAATCQKLLLSWGMTSLQIEENTDPEELRTIARRALTKQYGLKKGDTIIIVTSPAGDGKHPENEIRLTTI